MWLAALPLLLLPCCWLFWWAAGLHHGIVIGRSATLLLALGCVLAAYAPPGAALDPKLPRWRALLANPVAWCLAALAWQIAVWAAAAPVREPGLPWLAERAAALAAACGVAWWLGRAELPRAAWGLAGVGAVVLAIDAVGRLPIGDGDLGIAFALGAEPPFGNANFVVNGALPLLGLSLTLWPRERQSRPGRALQALLALGWISALVLGLGLRLGAGGPYLAGDGVRAAFIGAGAMIAAALALAAPARWHLALALVGVVGLWIGESAVTLGAVPLGEGASPSTVQRVHLWRSAAEAIAARPIAGYGPGAAVAVLTEQPSFAASWLAVPSYPEHAHHELLELLLDGGVINLLLIAGALAATLIPLWRRRGEAVPSALLVGWAGVIAAASVESHLSQPGPLLLLAALAGASWACAREGLPLDEPEPRARRMRRAACLAVALPLLMLCARELLGDGASVPERQIRGYARLETLAADQDWVAYRDQVRALRRRIGPLDDLAYREAYAERRIASAVHAQAKRDGDAADLRLADDAFARAEPLALEQAYRMPLITGDIALLDLLRRWREQRGDAAAAQRLVEVIAATKARCRELLQQVPENAKNREVRAALAPILGAAP